MVREERKGPGHRGFMEGRALELGLKGRSFLRCYINGDRATEVKERALKPQRWKGSRQCVAG